MEPERAENLSEKLFAQIISQELAEIYNKDSGMPEKRMILKRIHCIEEGLLAERTRILKGIYEESDVALLKERLDVISDDIRNLEQLSVEYQKMSGNYPRGYLRNARLSGCIKTYFKQELAEEI